MESAESKGLSLYETADFRMTAGKGIRAVVGGRAYLLGNERFLKENGVNTEDAAKAALDSLAALGKASVMISREGFVVLLAALLYDRKYKRDPKP